MDAIAVQSPGVQTGGVSVPDVRRLLVPAAKVQPRYQSGRNAAVAAQGDQQPAYVMPWLVGMQLTDADRLISTGGLKIAKTNFAPSPEWPKGTITEQTPSLGAKVTRDTPIELAVAQ